MTREQRPRRRLIQVANLTRDCEAKGHRVGWREPQLGKRNSELGRPSIRLVRDHHIPDGIPTVVAVVVVVPVAVDLDARRIDGEFVRGATVMVRINEHANPIARRVLIAAG